MHPYRSHTCGALRATDVGSTIRLSGWLATKRDHGGLLFADLRDHTGVTQIVAAAGSPTFDSLQGLSLESCISLTGTVQDRGTGRHHPTLPTGAIEVVATEVALLGACEALPFPVSQDTDAPEDLRLAHRFLEMRRAGLQARLRLRSAVTRFVRQKMWGMGFDEVQTPILTASAPEGARDFLVPSRLHPGQFYALPQAPQRFKQLLMVGGWDRYFQLAPCFRDEDPRADRSATDFTQIDLEMAFATQEDVFAVVEDLLGDVFRTFGGRPVDAVWPHIAHADSLTWFGTDKPDLRCPLRMGDVSDVFASVPFAPFQAALAAGGVVHALPVPTSGRAATVKLDTEARALGLPGLATLWWKEDGSLGGSLAKSIDSATSDALRTRFGLQDGDALVCAAGPRHTVLQAMAKLRVSAGKALGLFEEHRFAFAWIVDFPMFEEEDGAIAFAHNPFSLPQGGMEALDGDPLTVKAYQYDLACNGFELVSGGLRSTDPACILQAFALAGYTEADVAAKFGDLTRAFRFGAPPHGGCAAGLDRILMLLTDSANLREVTPFPTNQRGQDPLLGAPGPVTQAQLDTLGLRLVKPV
jgi:aspartyl-tRNA synthetase